MKFECRTLVESDYDDILVGWWKDWRWSAPPRDFLPQDGKGGIMISKDGTDICAGFIFFTNSKTAWCEFVVSNFHYREDDRNEALLFLIETLSQICKKSGYTIAYTSLRSESLIDKYVECGYKVGSKNCTELIKKL